MTKPLLSIVIPTYNRSHFLQRAVESALLQDYPNTEVLIVDNASTDDTASILNKYASNSRVHVHRRERNIGGCLNMGLSARNIAKGEYVVVLSDDDYYLDPTYLSEAVGILQSDPSCVFVHGEVVLEVLQFGEKKTPPRRVRAKTAGSDFFLGFGTQQEGFAHLMTVVVRREDLVEVNFYNDPDMPHGDSLAWLLLALSGSVAFVSRVVAAYVIHGENGITTRDPYVLLRDIRFIEIAGAAARESGVLPPTEVAKWLRRCRRTYCRKVISLMGPQHSPTDWNRILGELHAQHRIGCDPKMVWAVADRFARASVGRVAKAFGGWKSTKASQ